MSKVKQEILYIVMPAYNEETNIEQAVKSWYSLLEDKGADSKLIVADSGSTDSTHEILQRMQKIYPKLEVLSDTKREHGPKVIALYDFAIEHGADYIFQTDSDRQTSPDEFEAFWNLRENWEVVLGYRKGREDGRVRAFISYVTCLLLRIYFGVSVPDANAPFRLMKADILKRYLYRIPQDYAIPNIILTAFFVYYHERVTFRTITFRPRQGGVNSVNIRKVMKTGWHSLYDFKNFKKQCGKNK